MVLRMRVPGPDEVQAHDMPRVDFPLLQHPVRPVAEASAPVLVPGTARHVDEHVRVVEACEEKAAGFPMPAPGLTMSMKVFEDACRQDDRLAGRAEGVAPHAASSLRAAT